ncbi:hypothetical protein HD806DRAFT_534217 [Xylariaceae sp. AK1471]|nr:hypothetical protein HD806DRAFT_534217 [Xylariaceae sp. AK1471]
MEPPSKRLRLDPSSYGSDEEEDQDELSLTPVQFDTIQDPMYQLDKGRAKAATRLKSTFEDIFEKYGKDFDGADDVINFYTDEIEVDNGHVQSLENGKDGLAEDSLSSDEEERIIRGKPGGSGKKSRSKSLIPANPFKYNRTPQFQSPWNEPPGLSTYRLSSLAFPSSPYEANPPFDFGHSLFGNGLVDPVWQAPELPVRPLHYQHGSLIGVGRSQYGLLGSLSHRGPKRLVSAKSFLLHDASPSQPSDADAEEDDILLGRNEQEILSHPALEGPEKSLVPTTSGASLYQSNQKVDLQPQFYGIDPTEDELRQKPNDVGKELVQDRATEVLISEVLTSQHIVEEDTRPCQTTGITHIPPSLRKKRGRPKKLDAEKSAILPNQEPTNNDRPLRPNERRIEVIIPMLNRMLPTKIKQAAEGKEPVPEESSHELSIERRGSVAKDIEATLMKDGPLISHSAGDEDVEFQHSSTDLASDLRDASEGRLAQVAKCRTQSSSPSNRPESQKRRLMLTPKPIDLSNTVTSPKRDKRHPENACNKASPKSQTSQPEADNFTDNSVTENPREVDLESDCCNKSERMALNQQFSRVVIVDGGEEQVACNTSVEDGVESILIDKHNPDEFSVQSSLSTEIPDPASTEAVISEMIISPRLENGQLDDETVPGDELEHSSAGPNSGEGILPIRATSVPSNSTDFHHVILLGDVVGGSDISSVCETRVSTSVSNLGSRSPDLSVLHETTESKLCQGRGLPSLTLEASETHEDQDDGTSDQPSFTSVAIAKLDGHQLDPERQDIQRRSSLGAVELPDRDLSAFTGGPDVFYNTSELVLRLSSQQTGTNAQPSTGVGRSPSPELGTPIGSEIIRGTASPAPMTPTKRRAPRRVKRQSSHSRTSSSKRFPLTSLIPDGVDDESDDELSIAGSVSSRSRLPFSRASPSLPPLHPTSRKMTRKSNFLIRSPTRTPNRNLGLNNTPPATDSRAAGRSRQGAWGRAVHSSPLARTAAERFLISTPTRRSRLHHATPTTQNPDSSLVASPHGTLRRCGKDGFACERDFCLTCCK